MSGNEIGVVRYRLAADQSRFVVQAFAEGLFSGFGHNPIIAVRDFTGDVQFVSGTLEAAQLRMTVRADSFVVAGDVKEKDRLEIERMMHEEVLETEKYPEIVFASTSVSASRIAQGRYRVRIIGDLTLHGVTQSNLWVYTEVSVNEESLHTQGEFTLKQTDYGIKPTSVAGGTLKVKNEVKLSYDIKGMRS
jgi:polyisoprenoid-binding protein YceI